MPLPGALCDELPNVNPPEDGPAEDPKAPPNGLLPAAAPEENADPEAAIACFVREGSI